MRRLPLLLLVACGYSSDDFQRHYPPIACDRAERCQSWSSFDLDPMECRTERALDFTWFFGPEAGFDPSRAHECLNDLTTADCEEGTWPYGFASCQSVY